MHRELQFGLSDKSRVSQSSVSSPADAPRGGWSWIGTTPDIALTPAVHASTRDTKWSVPVFPDGDYYTCPMGCR